MSGWAELRSVADALAIAEAHGRTAAVSSRTTTLVRDYTCSLQATKMLADGVTPAFYVFNRAEKQGWTIVSAETATPAVLAYGEEGEMDWANLNPTTQWWLDRYANQIEILREHPERAAAPLATTYSDIAPLIGSKWSQDAPYNQYCPSVSGSRCPTGCVATAIGQIMYLHRCPVRGTGSHSYTSETYNFNLSADFGSTTYNWGKMTPTYSSSSSAAAKEAVATLLYHVGISCDMDYDPNGSGAQGDDAMAALVDHFGYHRGWTKWEMDYLTQRTMLRNIQSELQAGRPVFMTGYSWTPPNNYGGHAFVCEGMRNDGYVYINWGWGGMSDGYFDITVLDPDEQGTGGSSAGYRYWVTAYGGIAPAESMPEFNTDWTHALLIDSTAEVGALSLRLMTNDYVAGDTLGSSMILSLPCTDAETVQGTWVMEQGALTTKGDRIQAEIENGMITIVAGENDYTIYYDCQTPLLSATDTLVLPKSSVEIRRADGTPYELTNVGVNALPVHLAVPYAEAHLSRTVNGPVPAFVRGVVSKMLYTLAQVKSTKRHRFLIAGYDGSTYSSGVKDATYLDGEDWDEAKYNTMSLGDTVVVFGSIRRWNTGQSIQEFATLYRLPNQPTALKQVESGEKAVKIIRNGRLIILRKGEEYDLLGGKL